MRRFMAGLLTLVATILVVVLGYLAWAASGRGDGAAILETPPEKVPELPDAAIGYATAGELGVVTWNIGYGRGAAGDLSGPWTREHVERHLDGIADAIRNMNVDIAALQEVDLGASRSHDIHQALYIARRLGWPYFACVTTWQANYVPFPYWPPSKHYGQMKSGQCVVSRFPIKQNVRYRLQQPEKNPFYYNAFYLHRAIQHVTLVMPDKEVQIFNVHLEAYDQPTREQHAKMVAAIVGDKGTDSTVLLGDMNAPPPDAPQRTGFVDEPEMDFSGDKTIQIINNIRGLTDSLSGRQHSETCTFPADKATRRLDYVYVGAKLTVKSSSVVTEAGPLSDHLPVVARLHR